MALLVDRSWCEANDLQAYDSAATTVAAEEGIDLAAKMSGSEVWIMDRVDAFLRWQTNLPDHNLTALTATNVVIDERLRRWHLANILAALYRDAAFSQVNDRFEKKWKIFEQDAAQRKIEYFEAGVPYVVNPVRKPHAPSVTVVSGTRGASAYSVAITRVDPVGYESALSEITAAQAAAGNGITVAAKGLAERDRWNVYATSGEGPVRRQNEAALDADSIWTMPASGLSDGGAADAGQRPIGRIRQRRILPRG